MSSKIVPGSDKRSASYWPEDVGIIAMEVYFPSQYVEQEQLEQFDEVSQGKYTIGLGQKRMGFCSDCEDINSLCLTALTKLVENTGISYSSIGRLEVGTETVIDKSKSVKTALMAVLAAAGNTDVEGIDTHNACYGGTAALLNAVNWVESSAWDGRLAVVLAGDIAVYATGAARPTGGAGAVAMLVGPHAPLVLDRGVRSSHMNHAYDFYKPDLSSQYPRVDGKLSIQCYFSALDTCYNLYLKKAKQKLGITNLNNFDALLFHTPYCKLVQKSVARLAFNDFLNTPLEEVPTRYPGLEAFRKKTLEETYFDRDIEKAFLGVSSEAFESKTKPSLLLASVVGNMYTPSLYGGLASLLYRYSQNPSPLIGKRLCLFSYGSGLASTMFSIQVKCGRQLPKVPRSRAFTLDCVTAKGCASKGTDYAATNGTDHDDACSNGTDSRSTSVATTSEAGVGQLNDLVRSLADLEERLEARRAVTPQEFSDAMQRIEDTHHLAPHAPVDPPNTLVPGTWHLTHVDALHRRHYARVPLPRQQQQEPEVQELHLQQELALGGPAAAATVAVAKCVLAPAASPAVGLV